MRYENMRRGLVIACTLAMFMIAMSTSLRANACNGSHGGYTSVLCLGDRVSGSGSYIVSPNGNYRMYNSGGYIVVFDVSNPGSWVGLYMMYGAPNVWAMTVGGNVLGGNSLRFLAYDDTDLGVTGYYHSGVYLRLDNDGCVRWYHESDDSLDGVDDVSHSAGGCN